MNNFLSRDEKAKRKIAQNLRINTGAFNTYDYTPIKCAEKSRKTKYVDVNFASYPISSTASFTLLNGIQGGTDFYQRTNRATEAKELKLKLLFTQTATATGWYAGDSARIIVLWDHQADNTPVASDLLQDVNATGVTATTNFSHKNINNKERFIFLFDQNYQLPSYSVTTAGQINSLNSAQRPNGDEWSPTINLKLDKLLTRFNNGNATITSINNGALYFFVLGSVAPGSTGWSVSMKGRFSFFDA